MKARLDVPLGIGQIAETVNVTSEVSPLNTTDASLGNVITGQQVRTLPLEANNVVGLLSLQPGAVYCRTRDARTPDRRRAQHRSAQRRGQRQPRRPVERHPRRHRRQRPAVRHRLQQRRCA